MDVTWFIRLEDKEVYFKGNDVIRYLKKSGAPDDVIAEWEKVKGDAYIQAASDETEL